MVILPLTSTFIPQQFRLCLSEKSRERKKERKRGREERRKEGRREKKGEREGGRKEDVTESRFILAIHNIYPQIHEQMKKMLCLSYQKINFQ